MWCNCTDLTLLIFAGDHSLVQGLKGDATYLVVTENSEIEKFGINGEMTALHFAQASVLACPRWFIYAACPAMWHREIRQIVLSSRHTLEYPSKCCLSQPQFLWLLQLCALTWDA